MLSIRDVISQNSATLVRLLCCRLNRPHYVSCSSVCLQWRSRTFGRPGPWSNLPPFRLRFL